MLKEFEKEAIRILTKGKLPDSVVTEIIASEEIDIDHTGVGYFIHIKNKLLSIERMVLNEPHLLATSNDGFVGLLIFVQDSELTLECHGYGDEVPENFRENNVAINAT